MFTNKMKSAKTKPEKPEKPEKPAKPAKPAKAVPLATSPTITNRPLPPSPDSDDEGSNYTYLDMDHLGLKPPCLNMTDSGMKPLRGGKSHPQIETKKQMEIQKLSEALKSDKKLQNCTTPSCDKQLDVFCTLCKKVLCYRCGKAICEANNNHKHEFIDFDDYLAEKTRLYEMWLTGKKNSTMSVDREMREIALSIKKKGTELANSSMSELSTTLGDIITQLSNKQNELQCLTQVLKELESIIDFYTSNVEALCSVSFIKLVDQLAIPEKSRYKKYNLGKFDTLASKACEYLALTEEGNMLVSTSYAVDVFTQASLQSVGNIPIGGHVSGYQWYNGLLYVAVEMMNRGDKMIVYDQLYMECAHWMTDIKICDLAVNNDQIYVCTHQPNIHVFSTQGKHLYEISEGVGQRITHHPIKDMLIVTNHADDRVFGLNGVTKEVLWTQEIEKPWGAYVDEYEAIWAWSEYNQSFFVYDEKGKMMQEVGHPKLTGIGDINAVCVHSGRMWIGYDGGIYRFHVGFS